MIKKPGNLVVAIYSHPEYYPPTLNALDSLSPYYSKIVVVHRNIMGFGWDYPENVSLVSQGNKRGVREVERSSLVHKIIWFIQYTWLFFLTARKYRPDTILIYDTMPILSYRLFSSIINSPKILWYHNHDVCDENHIRRFSLSWLAWKSESWLFNRLNIFSLPAVERKPYFPMDKLKGNFFFLPNYPSIKRVARLEERKELQGKTVNILYQGSMNSYHSLEEIISLLGDEYSGYDLNLILKGFASEAYLKELFKLATDFEVSDRMVYLSPTTYTDVLENARKCHIGIGIHKGDDIMNSTLGTASNKIYEYVASGMAVLLFRNEHFVKICSGKKWALFTDGSMTSLRECIAFAISNMNEIREAAIRDFKVELNFEKYIHPVLQHIMTIRR